MPIKLEVAPVNFFTNWLFNKLLGVRPRCKSFKLTIDYSPNVVLVKK